jgi:hypothetical protein
VPCTYGVAATALTRQPCWHACCCSCWPVLGCCSDLQGLGCWLQLLCGPAWQLQASFLGQTWPCCTRAPAVVHLRHWQFLFLLAPWLVLAHWLLWKEPRRAGCLACPTPALWLTRPALFVAAPSGLKELNIAVLLRPSQGCNCTLRGPWRQSGTAGWCWVQNQSDCACVCVCVCVCVDCS